MKKKLSIAVAAGLFSACCSAAGNGWNTASDLLALGLPATAAAYTAYQQDGEGGRQLLGSLVGTVGTAELLKSQVSEMRPDRSDDKSFPSGHAAVAFASARYLHKRYEQAVNPYLLYGAAGLTALARVQADKHYWKDTVAGAALGYAWAEYFTDTRSGERVSLLNQPHGLAVAWQRPW